jgi:hypothetical protein
MLTSDMENIIRLDGVSYSYYNRIPAVCDISLAIKEGERFAAIFLLQLKKEKDLQSLVQMERANPPFCRS